ncbi:hypothetical protein BJX68DRAFT_230900 [Aspergillus pseudodeflectus]|uniref:GPI anchored protein n=1 Tax=Aspergillus pseudodeflectus TaxID=176178 RepID=A0ABR4KWE6_9EURO
MKLALALIPALAGLSVADDVVSLLLYGVDRDSAPEFEVTLLGSDKTATSYSLGCPETYTSGQVCTAPARGGFTAEVINSSTYAWWKSGSESDTTWGCTASATDEAACHRTISGEDQGVTASFTNYMSVTVTATATETGSSSASETSSTASDGPSPTATPSADGDEEEDTASETSTGGVPKMTGAAGLVLGGAAAAAFMGAVL